MARKPIAKLENTLHKKYKHLLNDSYKNEQAQKKDLRQPLKAATLHDLIKMADRKGISKETIDEETFDNADQVQQLIHFLT